MDSDKDKSSFQQLAEQSEEEFRKQFDPQSESFHGGLTTPVPLNGDRVPESMPSMYPEGYDPNSAPEPVDYGEEYRKIEEERKMYQDLKKSLAKLCPVVEAFLRHEEAFKLKGDPNNEKHLQILEQNIQKEKLSLKAVTSELEEYIGQLDGAGEEGRGLAKQLVEVLAQSDKKYDSKQSLTNFNFKVKKLSTAVFASAQKCLQKMKDIKKKHNSPA